MDKSTIFFSQLLILGSFICMTTAVSLRHKRNVIAGYQWPEPNPEINQFPHESTCHYYYLALSEEDITVNKCPDGELFDYIDHKCSRKETARCWSRHFGKMKHHHILLKSRGQFRCPYAWGKYPDIKDCTKYYVCLSGKVKHRKCAPYEHFDKVSRKCVAAIDGVCADQTDVVDPDYMCPRTWGSFSFPKDCSKYYECLEKKPNLRTCPTDTLFHERKEKCLPQNHVHCDSRHNPYKETPTIDESTHPENPIVTSGKPIQHTITAKETKSNVKITSETKISTIDPNSIIVERIPSIPDAAHTTQSPEEQTTGESSSKNLIPLISNETQSPKELPTAESLSNNAQNSTPSVLNESELTDLPSKQSFSNEIESLMDVNTEIISVNDTDEITDDDSGNTDEFIEISTSETKSSSSSVTQAITVDSAQNTKAEIGEIKVTVESAQNTEAEIGEIKVTVDSAQNTKAEIGEIKVTVDSAQNTKAEIGEIKVTVDSAQNTKAEIGEIKVTVDSAQNTKAEIGEIKVTVDSAQNTKAEIGEINVTVDSAQNTKAEVGEIIEQQTTPELPQATLSDECSPKDPTCITEESGRIVRCPTAEGLHPYPEDERRFLSCENSNIRVRYCSGDMIFNLKAKKCVGNFIF